MDYNATNEEFTFSSSSLQQCVNIAIVDDSVSEQLETFSVTIDTSVDRVVLEPNTTVVEIVDNDGERERERERKRERERERERERREAEMESKKETVIFSLIFHTSTTISLIALFNTVEYIELPLFFISRIFQATV